MPPTWSVVVDFVFSPYGTPLTLVASEISEKHKKIMLACAASGEVIWERGYRYVFGVYALANRYFIGLLDIMARNGHQSLSLIYNSASPFTVTVIGRFKVDASGKQIGHNPILIQWQSGNKEIVWPTKMQTAPPLL